MKKIILLLALAVLITSCSEVDRIFDTCKIAFADETIKITGNTDTFYINYPLGNEYTQARFELWDNLINNKIISLKKESESYKITNLLKDNIEVCTKSKDSTLEYFYEKQEQKSTSNNDGTSAILIEESLI